jgi:PleD family two-component response regulator
MKVTFSAGVTQYPEDGKDLQALYQTAGEILEKTKDLEGNCILPATWKSMESQFPLMDVILLYEDSPFATSIMAALSTRGYHAHWLKDGKTALDIFTENKPSLHAKAILVEENLPLLSGIEILKHFKREKITQRAKVIWLSEESGEVEKAKGLGCVDYIDVPCNISAFMLRLRQILGS